jgi:RNA polymerase sigma factor (sigma-70 family)
VKDPLKLRRSIQLTACAALITTALYPAAEATAIEKIQRYCTASWKNAGISDYDWDDCSQEAIENLLERVSRAGLTAAINRKESDERRELNRSIWRTAQRWRRAKRPTSLDALESFQPVAPPIDNGHSEKSEMLDALRGAMVCLSDTQQKIIEQSCDGASVREIASSLNMPASRVSDHKYKAIRKIQRHLNLSAV